LAAPVAIDARAAVRTEIGGVERYTRELARRLPALAPGRYRVLRPRRALAHRAGHLWEQAVLPLEPARLIYCPANLAPLASRRNVVVIHDAAAFRFPEAYSRPYAIYQRKLLPAIAARAKRVITVSEFARAELAELLALPDSRITVIPEGVDERFRPDADPEPARRAYGLREPYVLAVGTRSARKNLGALEPAARTLRERGIELVLAGSDRGYLRGADPAPGLRRLGYIADELLPGLYAGALALVMPSRHEGFGLPCLEAMATGVPVVAARAGALPETCGEDAVLVEPEDRDAFAAALLQTVSDETLRERLSAAGRARAAAHSWTRTAELTDAVIGGLLLHSQP
jgi:glycosyltransferase involved in cell wall biosynthesis